MAWFLHRLNPHNSAEEHDACLDISGVHKNIKVVELPVGLSDNPEPSTIMLLYRFKYATMAEGEHVVATFLANGIENYADFDEVCKVGLDAFKASKGI
jgi:hypothetical protein